MTKADADRAADRADKVASALEQARRDDRTEQDATLRKEQQITDRISHALNDRDRATVFFNSDETPH